MIFNFETFVGFSKMNPTDLHQEVCKAAQEWNKALSRGGVNNNRLNEAKAIYARVWDAYRKTCFEEDAIFRKEYFGFRYSMKK